MSDNTTIFALLAILAGSAIATVVYGNRYRKRRRAEKLRRRGYKAYNRDRPKRVIDPVAPPSAMTESSAHSPG